MADLDFYPCGVRFPLNLGSRGRIEVADPDRTIHQMILQILFTSPGERPNRPDFGVGVRDLVFEPSTELLASRVRRRLRDNLHDYVPGVTLAALAVDAVFEPEPMLVIRIAYDVRGSVEGTRELHVEIPRMTP